MNWIFEYKFHNENLVRVYVTNVVDIHISNIINASIEKLFFITFVNGVPSKIKFHF